MKIINRIVCGVFLIMGILVLVFNQQLYHNIDLLMISVGFIMITTRLSDLIRIIVYKQVKQETMLVLHKSFTILIGVMTFFLIKNDNKIVVFSVLWSVWQIMTEGEEIYENALKNTDCKIYCFFNISESIIAIVYSIILVFNPTHHHLFDHIILFGIELTLEFLFPSVLYLEKRIMKKKREKANVQ